MTSSGKPAISRRKAAGRLPSGRGRVSCGFASTPPPVERSGRFSHPSPNSGGPFFLFDPASRTANRSFSLRLCVKFFPSPRLRNFSAGNFRKFLRASAIRNPDDFPLETSRSPKDAPPHFRTRISRNVSDLWVCPAKAPGKARNRFPGVGPGIADLMRGVS